MKTLLIAALSSLLAISAFSQTQGVSLRSTNGVAFGTLTVQGHVDGTNTSVTNKLLGKFVTGAGNIPAGAFGIVGGVNNQSGQNGITVGAGNLVSAANALSGGRSNSIGSDAINSISAGFLNTGSGQNSYVNGENNNGGGQDGFLHGSSILVNSGIAGVDHNFLIGQRYSLQDGTSNTFVWSVGSPTLALDGSDSGAFYINASNKIALLGAPIYGNGLGLTNIPGASITTPFVGVSGVSPYVVSNLWSVVLPDGATAFQLGNPGAGYANVFATNFLVTADGIHYTIFTQGTNTLFGGDVFVTNGVYHGKSFRPQLVAATIVGATAQATNLMELQDGSSNVLASVTASGVFTGNGAGLTNLNAVTLLKPSGGDDTGPIQAALNTAAANVGLGNNYSNSTGGFVHLSAGNFLITNTILITNGCGLIGEGPQSTLLKMSGSNTVLAFYHAQPGESFLNGIAVRDLGISYLVTPATNSAAIDCTGNGGSAVASKHDFKNLNLYKCWFGIVAHNLIEASFDQIHIYQPQHDGIKITGYATATTIKNCFVNGSTYGSGYNLTGFIYGSVLSCAADNCVYGLYGDSVNSSAIWMGTENNTGTNLYLKASSGNSIQGYYVGSTAPNLLLDSCDRIKVLQPNTLLRLIYTNSTRVVIEDTDSTSTTAWQVNNNTLLVTETNVGVRMISQAPNHSLTVGGSNPSNGGDIGIGTTPAYQGVLTYAAAGNTLLTLDNSYDNAAAAMKLRMRTAGSAVDAMTILGSGNVGVGTTPAAKLDVAGAIHSGVTNTTTPALVSLGTNNAVLRCPDGGSWILRVGNDGTLSTVTNSAGL